MDSLRNTPSQLGDVITRYPKTLFLGIAILEDSWIISTSSHGLIHRQHHSLLSCRTLDYTRPSTGYTPSRYLIFHMVISTIRCISHLDLSYRLLTELSSHSSLVVLVSITWHGPMTHWSFVISIRLTHCLSILFSHRIIVSPYSCTAAYQRDSSS